MDLSKFTSCSVKSSIEALAAYMLWPMSVAHQLSRC